MKKSSDEIVFVCVCVPRELIDQLDTEAKAQMMSRSDYIRNALVRQLAFDKNSYVGKIWIDDDSPVRPEALRRDGT